MSAAARRRPRTPGRLPVRRWVADLTAMTLLLSVPTLGFWPTFAGPAYLAAAVGGLAAGLALAAAGAIWRWGLLTVSLATAAAYFLLGGALALPHTTVAGVVPTLETLWQLALGTVTSWKQLLTTVAPVAASDGHLVVPFLLTLVAAVAAASIALRAAQPAWALLVVGASLAIEIALGTSQPFLPVLQGVAVAIVGGVWLSIRQAWRPEKAAVSLGEPGERAEGARGRATRRVVTGAGLVAVAVVAGVALSTVAAPATPRYVLRDVVIPPFDVREYPSPLQGFRGIVRDQIDEALFRVSGLPEGARVRVATMDAYTGMVYNVSDEGAGSSSAFTPVRGSMSPDAEGTPVTLQFQIDEWNEVWMPDAGAVRSVTFEGDRAEALRRAAHYNEATGTGVVTSPLAKGDAYTVEAVLPVEHSDESLADAGFAPISMPKQDDVPQEFGDIASKAVGQATTPIEQARALQTMLSEGGFFSHGLQGEALSRAGHGAERISTLLGSDQMVGDDEQYATAMALLAGQLGMPARVVMGFYPSEDQKQSGVFTATGDALHAWVEIAFEGAGWVPFDPTPPEDKLPNDQSTKPRADPKPQVLQPPPPEQEPVDLPPTVPDEREGEDDEASDSGLLLAILGAGAGILGILLLLAAPIVVIGVLKAVRRRRRREAERAADRISGGWDEIVDRAVDYGTPISPGATRIEDATLVSTAFAAPLATALAHHADAQVFGPSEPSPEEIEEFWRQVEGIVGGMGSSRTAWQRLRARLSLRSLLIGTRFERAPRAPRTPRASRKAQESRAPAGDETVDEPQSTENA